MWHYCFAFFPEVTLISTNNKSIYILNTEISKISCYNRVALKTNLHHTPCTDVADPDTFSVKKKQIPFGKCVSLIARGRSVSFSKKSTLKIMIIKICFCSVVSSELRSHWLMVAAKGAKVWIIAQGSLGRARPEPEDGFMIRNFRTTGKTTKNKQKPPRRWEAILLHGRKFP